MIIGKQKKDYQKSSWKEVFAKMVQSSASIVYLFGNKNDQIVKQIQHVHYKKLKLLTLSDNNIDNIENLTIIKFQVLRYLQLRNNRISRITCFHKLSTFGIKQLRLGMNPLDSIDSLQRLSLSKNSPKKIELEFSIKQPVICDDLSILTKMSPMLSEEVKIIAESIARIKQPKVKQIIQKDLKAQFTAR